MSMRQDVVRDFQRYRKITKPASKQRFKLYADIKKRIIYIRKHKARSMRDLYLHILKTSFMEEKTKCADRFITARFFNGRAA